VQINKEVESLKLSIKNIYSQTKQNLRSNIYRGHSRSISSDIEDQITVFISNILPKNFKFLLDSSLNIDGKNNRPDLIVVDEDNNVKFLIELKANMGYCRNATKVIDDIRDNHEKFSKKGSLICKFSDGNQIIINYNEEVKLFLISFTDNNCSSKKHVLNKNYADQKGVHHFNLFSGWYGDLTDKEVDSFVVKIL
jgi:hypothetical protein